MAMKESSPEVGSSQNKILGFVMISEANANLRRWPPDMPSQTLDLINFFTNVDKQRPYLWFPMLDYQLMYPCTCLNLTLTWNYFNCDTVSENW